MEPFATVEELKARLDWTLDEGEERIAAAALEDASDMARAHGRNWTIETAPRMVRTTVLVACARYMRNPDGYTTSRAGDETLSWSDALGDRAGSVYFTDDEIKVLRTLAGNRPSIISAGVYAWNPAPAPQEGYVPDSESYEPILMFSSDTEPW